MLAKGHRIEKYQVLARLGGGGFADVYRARHVHLDTDFALKILKPEHVDTPEVRMRFLDEARVQARLVHPGIARVTDILAEPGVAGIVLEFLEGRSLDEERRRRGGRLPEADVIALFDEILDALHFAHESGVVHRDIKPENIFLADAWSRTGVPKILDFGIAQVRGDLRRTGQKNTTTRIGMGTTGYASPEQIRSAGAVDRRADIFSLGVVLYELMTGALPFDRGNDADSLVALMTGAVRIPAELQKSSPRIASAIARCMQPDPAERYADCAALKAWLRSKPVGVRAARSAAYMVAHQPARADAAQPLGRVLEPHSWRFPFEPPPLVVHGAIRPAPEDAAIDFGDDLGDLLADLEPERDVAIDLGDDLGDLLADLDNDGDPTVELAPGDPLLRDVRPGQGVADLILDDDIADLILDDD